jgi:hypothetical protein
LGLHQIAANRRPVRAVAVVPRDEESDLARLTPAEAERRWASWRARVLPTGGEVARAVREDRFGRELWREMLLAALLLLVAETVLARLWGARRRADEESAFEADTTRAAAGGRG